MEGHLSLVKDTEEKVEKRIFPRFPFGYLIFKSPEFSNISFLVRDISFSGMQLSLKSGEHSFRPNDSVSGSIHWKGRSLEVSAQVVWVKDMRLGLRFVENESLLKEIKNFLAIDNVIAEMKAIHLNPVGVEIPQDLKVWLKADGPFEVFVWTHSDGEIAKFQFLMMDNFLEYEAGRGIQSGKVLRVRDRETPLYSQDEVSFSIDKSLDPSKYEMAKSIVDKIPEELLSRETRDFLLRKLS